jgi:hypothetical protein
LFRVSGNEDNLIDNLLERIDQTFDKCPAKIGEKILFLPVCTSCLATNQYHCRSHSCAPYIKMISELLNHGQETKER